ncbi:DUF2357 domain-containing protein [Conexibacter stalactiti]|uniref:DUF2357 domain-containing protein n=1 Tax=Conexibacter stalactiti TaxID=1940611 RepID=A0ABU4HUF5_9ACTN|nr:DUF2357 domain-containing protein [Conexibacter stalactiti]MDW5595669.1 DUF2357 domain-containing protein [Conexibacter stalactiti]MEC5036311.1 DUF2357 domain-containing protein [Conexibacter stalactiti]
MSDSAVLRLLDRRGRSVGRLVISTRPRSNHRIFDVSGTPGHVRSAPAVEVEEGARYRYKLELEGVGFSVGPEELFDPDDETGLTGRLNTGQAVGEVEVTVERTLARERWTARAGLTVRPRKLDADAFFAMQRDIADVAVELLHQGFAPSAGRYKPLADRKPQLLYQQFALLSLHLFDRDLYEALRRIVAHPHRSWRSVLEPHALGTAMRGGAWLGTSLAGPGPRTALPASALVPSVPRGMYVERSESTSDNVPNRYVRFVLERWRALAVATREAIERQRLGRAPARRGRSQVARAIELLDELLAHPSLREVGSLAAFPQGNQVLLKHDGYRQVAAAAAIIEASLGLDMTVEDPFVVSQRNVDTLYEYWCFMQLAEQVGDICGQPRTRELFQTDDGEMSLKLKRGLRSQLKFEHVVQGRVIEAELFFNRYFTPRSPTFRSWTRRMNPDCSLLLRTMTEDGGARREWWVHFDAKYRVRLDASDASSSAGGEGGKSTREDAVAADLLKMHAYRDGIRNSAAAFVLFPGRGRLEYRFAESEILPSLGAFPLVPDRSRNASRALREFLVHLFEHVADRASRLDRARYWSDVTYGSDQPVPPSVSASEFLERPPADSAVLLGYVRGKRHRRWIEEARLYNVRGGRRRGAIADGAIELDARLLLLYGSRSARHPPALFRRVSHWQAVSRETMRSRGYPQPRGDAYLCCAIERLPDQPTWLSRIDIRRLIEETHRDGRHLFGSPTCTTWLEVLRAADPD